MGVLKRNCLYIHVMLLSVKQFSAAAKDLYHSVGDDPWKTSGETERPVFTMPLWAFDSTISD